MTDFVAVVTPSFTISPFSSWWISVQIDFKSHKGDCSALSFWNLPPPPPPPPPPKKKKKKLKKKEREYEDKTSDMQYVMYQSHLWSMLRGLYHGFRNITETQNKSVFPLWTVAVSHSWGFCELDFASDFYVAFAVTFVMFHTINLKLIVFFMKQFSVTLHQAMIIWLLFPADVGLNVWILFVSSAQIHTHKKNAWYVIPVFLWYIYNIYIMIYNI